MTDGQRRDGRRDDDIGGAAQRLDDQGRGERGGENRAGVGERISADDQFRRIEGAGERRAKRRRDRPAGAATHQDAQVLAAQLQRQADARGDGGADLRIARFEPDRRAAAVGDHGLRGYERAFADRHAAAAQGVGFDRIDRRRPLLGASPALDQPESEPAEGKREERRERGNPRRRAQSHIERDAVDRDMRAFRDEGHRGHAEAGQGADDGRDDDLREFIGADDGAQARPGDEQPAPSGDLHEAWRARPRRASGAAAVIAPSPPARSISVTRQCATAMPNSSSATA